MSEKPKSKPSDKKVVSTQTAEDVSYWTDILGATEENLKKAMKAVGNDPKKITAHLCMIRYEEEKSKRLEHG